MPRSFSFKSKLADEGDDFPQPHHQMQQKVWPEMRRYLREGFATRTRDEWGTVFDGTSGQLVAVTFTPPEQTEHLNFMKYRRERRMCLSSTFSSGSGCAKKRARCSTSPTSLADTSAFIGVLTLLGSIAQARPRAPKSGTRLVGRPPRVRLR